MIRNAKVLGLALVAALALSAAATSMATAAEETKPGLFTFSGLSNDNEVARVDAAQTEEGGDILTINGLTLTCKAVSVSGEANKTKASPEEDVSNGPQPGTQSTDITFGPPFYESCHVVVAGLTKTVTVTPNGCGTIFDAKTTVTDSGFDHTAWVTKECPTGKQIEIHVYNEKEAEATTLCTYDIKPQITRTGITLHNKVNTPAGVNDLLATVNTELAIINTKLSALCGEKENTTAVNKGEYTIRATNEAGQFIDMAVSD